MISQNVETVRNRIREACLRCGRNPEDVRPLAVSKTFAVHRIQEAIDAGVFEFGENFVQELKEKRQQLPDSRIRWHFIGHLQTNKVKYIAEYIHLIHSVDSLHLAEEIARRAEKVNRTIDVLIEVHTTEEATKSGVMPSEAVDLIKSISGLRRVQVNGLMTMGPFSDDPNDSRPSFRQLVDIKKKVLQEGIENVAMSELSMGMTHDFEVAIEEGATIVRLGTAIFGERKRT